MTRLESTESEPRSLPQGGGSFGDDVSGARDAAGLRSSVRSRHRDAKAFKSFPGSSEAGRECGHPRWATHSPKVGGPRRRAIEVGLDRASGSEGCQARNPEGIASSLPDC